MANAVCIIGGGEGNKYTSSWYSAQYYIVKTDEKHVPQKLSDLVQQDVDLEPFK